MAEPMRPAIRMDIITGASSLHMELPTTEPIMVAKPRSLVNTSEQARAIGGLGRRVAPIEVPQKSLAGGPGLRVFFRTPDGPKRRIVSFDTLVVRQQRFQGRDKLQPFVAVVIALRRE